MNWLEKICKEYDISRYRLSKSTGIRESYLSKIVNENITFKNIKVWQYMAIIDFFKEYTSEEQLLQLINSADIENNS